MVKRSYPEYHKALLEQSSYPSAPRRIKFEETQRSYLYKTGEAIYKIRKTGPVYSALAIKERFAQDALRLGRRWTGDVVQEVVPIVKGPQGYALGTEGHPVDYALKMSQLSDTYWLSHLIAQQKLTPTALGRLARFLSEHHEAAALEEKAADAGRPEFFFALMEEIFYQSKKYINQTLTEPMLEMVTRPLGKFVDDFRKLFHRRQKRGRVVDGHGAFVPEHIHIRGTDIHAIAPLDGQRKYRVLDAANDLATLLNALAVLGAHDTAELFLKRYIAASKDRELQRILPAYQTLQAMRSGLLQSEMLAELDAKDKQREAVAKGASAQFQLAVQMARQIPKSA